jgi:hypothetical protein
MNRLVRMVLEESFRASFPMGMLAGIWGVLMWPVFYSGAHMTLASWNLSRLLLFQGFLLLPLMGIGPYLLSRFFG